MVIQALAQLNSQPKKSILKKNNSMTIHGFANMNAANSPVTSPYQVKKNNLDQLFVICKWKIIPYLLFFLWRNVFFLKSHNTNPPRIYRPTSGFVALLTFSWTDNKIKWDFTKHGLALYFVNNFAYHYIYGRVFRLYLARTDGGTRSCQCSKCSGK